MKAVTYQGFKDVKVKEVNDPKIEKPDDIIVRLTSTAICGSDLHLIHGMIPNMPEDFIIGHEPMGIVEEAGPNVIKVKKGDRVIIPFNISCGECFYCKNQLESQCDNSNPHGETGAFFGYSETAGGYAGGQAEFLRVPYANFVPFRIPDDCEIEDEKLVLMSDAMATAYWSVDNAGVKKGDTVIVLGCGPVGLLTQKFAWLKGAKRVIAVDYIDYRLQHAKRTNQVEIVNFEAEENIGNHLKEMTKGGADVVIDCVGMDGKMTPLEMIATGLKLQGGAMGAIVIATQAVRKGGTIQITGVYGMRYNAFPLGDIFQRNVNLRTGQAPIIHYMPHLYNLIAEGKVDPGDIVTHVLPLDQAEHGYEIFDTKTDGCIKVVLKP
ncbi:MULTISPECIES: zinc-dependent alcohol dehydrogenase [Brevibacillus]|jgi:S-(hydroxymethyl)glutathione dehydrogenase / alcohol dehydrogenase|uniref:zinc-dependent alcohol dehydrogenase n=1 Tax=Brevibacillus TaxID=55080 RepID=UPI000F08C89E|nr:zinc-dependent alcohol dehydrogenase [Brevibacillus borstelensis]MCM3593932.1 glutathione-dependent formaldehyde dehydrogenase [Brevibacillus borstelensis]MED1851477.1 glutathione-dependent formaldehyde dehydrogenase [Brevibacillus borstelensis]MED1875602.1 glutathione-dependent formaldehyde dehydrogenase [Brevibacillus borstelensis]MED1885239.1 glutathione-dependent formaldehyde dehydrogenase [Brevibacillus borstelensis]RNB61363.1 glutathione-dependent formaldehyde dehydrogenase [Brevibaci